MLPWFDRLRAVQIAKCETRSFPRIVPSLQTIGDLYLFSLPGSDAFLRRDGSVWEAREEGWHRNPTIRWTEAVGQERIAALVIASTIWQVPEVDALLPARSADDIDCPACVGRDVAVGFVVCYRCAGLGWIAAPAT